jgi:hypothetical protein
MLKNTCILCLGSALMLGGLQSASAQTLLLRYNFDEASSGATPALDSGTGNPVNGTFENGATRTANTPGGFSLGALHMPAGGDRVGGGHDVKFDGLSQFTLSTWINLQEPPVNHRLISKQSGGTFPGFSWHIINPSSGTISAGNFGLHLFVGGSTAFAHDNVAGVGGNLDADNKWLFVAVTYDGTATANNVNYYFGDPTSGVALSHTTTVNAGTVIDHTGRLMIGGTDAAPTALTVNPRGFMDDARVYSGILSLSDLDAVRLTNVPEPSSAALLLGGFAMLLGIRRWKRS